MVSVSLNPTNQRVFVSQNDVLVLRVNIALVLNNHDARDVDFMCPKGYVKSCSGNPVNQMQVLSVFVETKRFDTIREKLGKFGRVNSDSRLNSDSDLLCFIF